jgi:hypothetical protein
MQLTALSSATFLLLRITARKKAASRLDDGFASRIQRPGLALHIHLHGIMPAITFSQAV